MGGLAAVAPALSIVGTVLSAEGQLAQGDAAAAIGRRRQIEGEFEAKQLEQDAGQSIAVSQRNAADIKRQTTLINSAALARAAASGAGASDPSVIGTIARTAGEGAYRRGVALYEGEAQARMDRIRAAASRAEGELSVADADAAKKFSRIGALSTVLTGAGNAASMYSKYWSGPKSSGIGDGSVGFSNKM